MVLLAPLVLFAGCVAMFRVDGASQQQQKEAEEAAMQEQFSQFVNVKGAFVLEPNSEDADKLGMSSVPDTRQLVMVVFDVSNPTQQNISAGASFVKLSYPSGNDYLESSYDLPDNIRDFISNSGYTDLDDVSTIDAGTVSRRCISVFSVSKTDSQGSDSLKLTVDTNNNNGDNIKGSAEIPSDSIAKIAMPDGVFQVEDNPDGYQLRRSMGIRCQTISDFAYNVISAYNSRNIDGMAVSLAGMYLAIDDSSARSGSHGFSIALDKFQASSNVDSGDLFTSEAVPAMSYDALRAVDSTAADDAIALRDAIDELSQATITDRDTSAANTALSNIWNITGKYTKEINW